MAHSLITADDVLRAERERRESESGGMGLHHCSRPIQFAAIKCSQFLEQIGSFAAATPANFTRYHEPIATIWAQREELSSAATPSSRAAPSAADAFTRDLKPA
jgi:hypothetical protein